MFSSEISDELKYYVYRLIDPRSGETFYVGKGVGNRVYSHVAGNIPAEEDLSDKLRRIREIRLAGFEVAHVIHRHGMDEKTAFEVEAALIDAYPGITNIAGGHHNNERGVMHANEIIAKFEAEPIDVRHKLIAISINRSSQDANIYHSVRAAWRMGRNKAEKAEYVLAEVRGIVVGVFRPERWMDATPTNFPDHGWEEDVPGRIGFEGEEATKEVIEFYMRRRLPKKNRGAANPIRYLGF